MRSLMLISVLVAVGCGSTQPATEPATAQQGAPVASVESLPVDTAEPVAVVMDAAPADALIDIPVDAPIDALDPDDYYENGIHIVRAVARYWCESARDRRCFPTKGQCSKYGRGCKLTSEWFCFDITAGSHLGAESGTLCMVEMTMCERSRETMLMVDPSVVANVSDCTLMRVRGEQ
jgi:hypothetical protein